MVPFSLGISLAEWDCGFVGIGVLSIVRLLKAPIVSLFDIPLSAERKSLLPTVPFDILVASLSTDGKVDFPVRAALAPFAIQSSESELPVGLDESK